MRFNYICLCILENVNRIEWKFISVLIYGNCYQVLTIFESVYIRIITCILPVKMYFSAFDLQKHIYRLCWWNYTSNSLPEINYICIEVYRKFPAIKTIVNKNPVLSQMWHLQHWDKDVERFPRLDYESKSSFSIFLSISSHDC